MTTIFQTPYMYMTRSLEHSSTTILHHHTNMVCSPPQRRSHPSPRQSRLPQQSATTPIFSDTGVFFVCIIYFFYFQLFMRKPEVTFKLADVEISLLSFNHADDSVEACWETQIVN